MNCEKAIELMPLYLDQALDNVETKELRLHLLKCKSCKRELIALEEVVSKLQNLPQMDLPEGYHNELMEKIQAQAMAQNIPDKKKRFVPWVGLGATAAVLAAVVIGSGGLDKIRQLQGSPSNKEQNATVASARLGEEADGNTPELEIVATDPDEEAGFESMEDIAVLDPSEEAAAAGGLPGQVVANVIPSDEEFIIIDDGGLLEGGTVLSAPPVVLDAPAVNTAESLPASEAAFTEPVLFEEIPLEDASVALQEEPMLITAAEDVATDQMILADGANTQDSPIVLTDSASGDTADFVGTAEEEIAWEAIPEEDTDVIMVAEGTESTPTQQEVSPEAERIALAEQPVAPGESQARMAKQPMETATVEQLPVASPAKAAPMPAMENASANEAKALAQSHVVSFSLSGGNYQELLDEIQSIVENQGGMFLREVLYTGQNEVDVPVNRILFKIPNTVYDGVMEQLSALAILGDYYETQQTMDTVYDVLLQERNILEKNGGRNLAEQLAAFDRTIATWEEEQDYTAVYVTILENSLEE